jgi:hypothetical protein
VDDDRSEAGKDIEKVDRLLGLINNRFNNKALFPVLMNYEGYMIATWNPDYRIILSQGFNSID